MCVALNRCYSYFIIQLMYAIFIASAGVFSVRATATYSGNKITVSYDVSAAAVCTCQLDSGTPEPCKRITCVRSNNTILLSIHFR